MSYHAISTIPYHTIPYHTIPYHTIPYHTIPYHTILHHKIAHNTISISYIFAHFKFSRASSQIKRDDLSKEAGEFKNEYGSYMVNMSDTIQGAKLEHTKLTERVCFSIAFIFILDSSVSSEV
jgi:hypothetical protein